MSSNNFLEKLGYTIDLDDIVGRGGSSVVYNCTKNKKECVCKIIDKKNIESSVESFIFNEKTILEKLDHPSIVSLLDFVETDDQIFQFMEKVDGRELYSYVIGMDFLSEVLGFKIFEEVSRTIRYCHDKNVIHRDITLPNILIRNYFDICLIDFGLSTVQEKNTFLSDYVGTVHYLPPEIINHTPYDGKKSDIWSLGVVLYVMLTGKYPFTSNSDMKICKKIISEEINFGNSNISNEVKTLISKMLSKNPDKRPTIEEVINSSWFKKYR